MPLKDLNEGDRAIVKQCLDCVAAGKVILHDWEFLPIMGVEVAELRAICRAWPDVDDSDVRVKCAVGNSLNNLLGYPHGKEHMLPVSEEEIARVFAIWRGRPAESYFDGLT